MLETLKICVIRGGAAAMAALLLGACVPTESHEQAGTDSLAEEVARHQPAAGMPEGALAIGDHLYAVPVAVDQDGCEQFREWSELGVERQVIYYRDGKGSFSAIKSEDGSCNAEMVESGADADGCPTFRAEQPDGTATDVIYYQSVAGGYAVNKAQSACAS